MQTLNQLFRVNTPGSYNQRFITKIYTQFVA